MKKNTYARENDTKFVKICFSILEFMLKPVVWWKAVLYLVVILAAIMLPALWMESILPFVVALVIAVLVSIPAVIGAVIRDRRISECE